MSGYDYNIGYLPSSVEQNRPIKRLAKWVLIALVIFVAVQYLQASSSEKSNAKQPVTQVNLNEADQSVTLAVETDLKIVAQQSQNLLVENDTATENNSIIENQSQQVIMNESESNIHKDESFDKDLAQLLNQLLPD